MQNLLMQGKNTSTKGTAKVRSIMTLDAYIDPLAGSRSKVILNQGTHAFHLRVVRREAPREFFSTRSNLWATLEANQI